MDVTCTIGMSTVMRRIHFSYEQTTNYIYIYLYTIHLCYFMYFREDLRRSDRHCCEMFLGGVFFFFFSLADDICWSFGVIMIIVIIIIINRKIADPRYGNPIRQTREVGLVVAGDTVCTRVPAISKGTKCRLFNIYVWLIH